MILIACLLVFVLSPRSASAGDLPGIFAGFGDNNGQGNDFKVRPHDIKLASAYGGNLLLRWVSYGQSEAKAVGSSHTGQKSVRCKVTASHENNGLFLQLDVERRIDGSLHSERLLLTISTTKGLYEWNTLAAIRSPGSGLTIYRGD